MNASQLWRVLVGRWRLVLLCATLFTAASAVVSWFLPKQYAASTALLIDSRGMDAQGNPTDRLQSSAQLLVSTQQDLLRSEMVALHVVVTLGLHEDATFHERWIAETGGVGDPRRHAAQGLLRQLDVQSARDSAVLALVYKDSDPVRAATVANTFASAYLQSNRDLKVAPSKLYAEWFDARTQSLRQSLREAQTRLAAFQRDRGLVVLGAQGSAAGYELETGKLGQVTSQLLDAQAARVLSAARRGVADGDLSVSSEVLNSPLVVDLRRRLSEARSRLQQLRSRFQDTYSGVVALKDEVATIERQLDEEMRAAARTVRGDLDASRQREAELLEITRRQRERVVTLSQATNEFAVLQRDVESAQRAVDDAAQRQAQAALQSQLQQVNAAQLFPAVVPVRPSSPRVLVNVALAAAIGVMVGIGLALLRELRSPVIRSPDDLVLALDLPLLVSVSRVPGLRRLRAGGEAPSRIGSREPSSWT